MVTVVTFLDFHGFLRRLPHERFHVRVRIFLGNLYKLSNYIRSEFDEFLQEANKKKTSEFRIILSRLNESLL